MGDAVTLIYVLLAVAFAALLGLFAVIAAERVQDRADDRRQRRLQAAVEDESTWPWWEDIDG
jgi:hypothetical protein